MAVFDALFWSRNPVPIDHIAQTTDRQLAHPSARDNRDGQTKPASEDMTIMSRHPAQNIRKGIISLA